MVMDVSNQRGLLLLLLLKLLKLLYSSFLLLVVVSSLLIPPCTDCRGSAQLLKGDTRSEERNPCADVRCRAGRVCSPTGPKTHRWGTCKCHDPESCPRSSHSSATQGKKVCGSDGKFYSSRCQLHGAACRSKVHVSVMRDDVRCIGSGPPTAPPPTPPPTPAPASPPGPPMVVKRSPMAATLSNHSGVSPWRAAYAASRRPIEKWADLGTSLKLKCFGGDDDDDDDDDFRAKVKGRIRIFPSFNGSGDFIWTKDGGLIRNAWRHLSITGDLILLIHVIGYQHAGVYTCLYGFQGNMHFLARYKLQVQSPALVRIYPSTQFHSPGDTVQLRCHVICDLQASISWHVNEEPLNLSLAKYQLSNENRTLEVIGARHKVDTGAYKCLVTCGSKTSQDISTVFVEGAHLVDDANARKESIKGEAFILFTRHDIKVADPGSCALRPISFQLPIHLHRSHHDRHQKTLRWESVATTRFGVVYASMRGARLIYRVALIDAFANSRFEEIKVGNCTPRNLRYLEVLDEIWGECLTLDRRAGNAGAVEDDRTGRVGGGGGGGGEDDEIFISSSVVIKNASRQDEIHAVLFIDLGDNKIKKLFLPPVNDLNSTWNVAFLTFTKRYTHGLIGFDLLSKKLLHDVIVDLTSHRCRVENLHYVLYGGKVIIECSSKVEAKKKFIYFLLDSITLQLETLQLPQSIGYRLSPDSKLFAGISDDLTCLIVYQVTSSEGMLEEVTNTAIMDWNMTGVAFIGSTAGGYDVVIECQANQELLKFDVRQRRVDIINKKSRSGHNNHRKKRHLVMCSFLGKYIMMPAIGDDGMIVLDVWKNVERCRWSKLFADFILWIEQIHFLK